MTSTAPSIGPVEPSWRAFLRRGLKPIVIGMVVGIVAGLLLTLLAQSRYTATTRVLVTATGIEGITQSATSRTPNTSINLDTEAQLVTSAAVVNAAKDIYPVLAHNTYQALVNDIAVSVPPNTTVMQIAFTANTARAAQYGANAVAEAYLQDRRVTAQNSLDVLIKSAQNRVSSETATLQQLTTKQGQAVVASTKALLSAQIGLVKTQITAVNAQLATLNVLITPGRVVTSAARPSSPSSPSLVLNVVSGFGVGLLVGLLIAWLQMRFSRSVRTADDLVRVLDLACLAVVPSTEADPRGARSAGAFRRVALMSTAAVQLPARILVSSPVLTESSCRVAAGMTVSLAQGGTTAALLQVHGPELEVSHPRSISSTRVNHADDLVSDNGDSLVEALDRIRGRHSVLVVDVPGATTDADAQTMAAHADAVVLVVDSGTATKTVRAAMAEFDGIGAPVLGAVLVLHDVPFVESPRTEDPLRPPWAGGVDHREEPAVAAKDSRPGRDATRAGSRSRSR